MEDRLEALQQELELISAAFSSSEVVIVSQQLDISNDGGEDTVTTQIKIICSSSTAVLFWLSSLSYPDVAIRISINSTELPRSSTDEFGKQIKNFIGAHVGNSYCFEAIQFVMETFRTVKETTAVHVAINSSSKITMGGSSYQLMQVLIWFHHIKSGMKKKEIKDMADDLSISGLWIEGFPGIIIAEGAADDVTEYIKQLQKLRWQHMVVRGERITTIKDDVKTREESRQLPMPLQEVDNMSEMGSLCKLYGVHDLFMTLHKGYASTNEA